MRPCDCDRFRPGKKLDVARGDCAACWLYHNSPRHRAFWDGAPQPTPAARQVKRESRVACTRRGEVTGEVQGCGCATPPKIYACQLHGSCVLIRDGGKRKKAIDASGLRVCRECEDRNSPVVQIQAAKPERKKPERKAKKGGAFRFDGTTPEYITTAKLMDDCKRLASMLPPDTSRIIGVARSGLCAASMVAMLLHRPLSIVRQSLGDVVDGGNGWRLHDHAEQRGTVVVIDDTVMTGNSFKAVLPIVRAAFPDALSAAVYVNPLAKVKPDLWARDLPWPHALEWNIYQSVLTPSMAFDFDGVLCHDCPPLDDYDGEPYLRFLDEAKPLYHVRKVEIPLIVTARLEKYRPQTMAWLARHGMTVKRLVMGPWASHKERAKADVAAYKAEHYRAFLQRKHKIKPPMFVESDARQAKRIAELSGGLVLCPGEARFYP